MKVYINGKYYDKDDAKVSVFDHGFLYGDGIFEGIRLYNKNVFKLPKHIDRLFRSARAIMLDMPWSKQEIMDAVCDACRVNNLTDGYIRLVVSHAKQQLNLLRSSVLNLLKSHSHVSTSGLQTNVSSQAQLQSSFHLLSSTVEQLAQVNLAK